MQGLIGLTSASKLRVPSLLILSKTSHSTRHILVQLKVGILSQLLLSLIALATTDVISRRGAVSQFNKPTFSSQHCSYLEDLFAICYYLV